MKFLFLSFCLISTVINGQNTIVEPVLNFQTIFPNVRDFSLSSSGDEAYFTAQSPLTELSFIVKVTLIDREWSKPELVSFSGQNSDLEPFLSPDNLRLYFASNRSLIDSIHQPKDYDIWYVERPTIYSEWGNAINIGLPINTEHNEFYPAVAENKNLYFTSDNPISKGKDDIFFCAWNDEFYSEPISLSDSINSDGFEFNAFISKDESYLIFSGYRRDDGLGSGDLYISFRNKEKQWSKAVNLGEKVNSKHMDYCPFVDQASQTLYFTSKRSSFDDHHHMTSMKQAIKELNKNENGMSRIYKTTLNQLIK